MRFTIFTPIVVMTVVTATMAELDRKTNGTIIPLTKRPSLLKADNTIDLDAVYSHIESIDTKILHGLENYEKNTGIPHPLSVKEIQSEPLNLKRAGAAAHLTSFYAIMWYTTIWIGTPARPFTVQIDTGMNDLFVPGLTCSYCEGHTKWDPKSSQTSVDQNLGFHIEFEDKDSVSGKKYTDIVTITSLTADRQTIGVATAYSPGMEVEEFPSDGMLGMAFQSISMYPDSPRALFETLIDEKKVEEPVFSIMLTSSGGDLYLGGINTDMYTGVITYTDVTVVGFWQVNIGKIRGNRKILLTDQPGIIDTGANFIFGDLTSVSRLHKALGGESLWDGYFSFPCNKFPTISFAFGDSSRTFWIPASLLNLGPVMDGSPDCYSGIVGRESHPFWTIGAVFLMGFYTVFDVGNKRVGFADLATVATG